MGDIVETAKGGCTASGGTVVAACDKTDSVGGCVTTNAVSTTTLWYYDGDEASVTTTWETLGGEHSYVAP